MTKYRESIELASLHLNRKLAEQVEVDWVRDPAHITDPDTDEILDAHIFVGIMTYSRINM